ncbi:hypothetical protein HZB05_02465 [Candidatus Wolfebacteria bacterium]|nr:hypothetical protein [Candidatus Wolfebacteria bacterium]
MEKDIKNLQINTKEALKFNKDKIIMNKLVLILKNKAKNFDIFELGNSFFLWYVLIFAILPAVVYLNSSFLFVSYKKSNFFFDFKTIFYLSAGILFFIIGYYFSLLKFHQKNRISDFIKKEWDYKKSYYIVAVLFILNLTVKIIRLVYGGYSHIKRSSVFTSSQFYSLIGLLDWLGAIVLAIAFINYFRFLKIGDKNYLKWRWIAWGLFVFEFFYGFFSLSRLAAITPVVVYLIVRHYLFERNYIRMAAVLFTTFILIFPILGFLRNPGTFYALNILNLEKNGQKMVIMPSSIGEFTSDSLLRRIGHPSVIIYNIFNKIDKFEYGRSFLNFFISLGPPRFIWKSKPVISGSGNEFGRQIGVLDSKDYTTSIGPSFIGDLYMNFGFTGIIIGMFIIGMLFRFMYDLFIKYSNYSSVGVMFYILAWIQLIKGAEDWIAPVWAGLVKLFVIIIIINYFLINRKK